ncbi:MAG: TPM domain-containing protein [Proteobacteria bacterium]|nr:TPM domain-containing protein [Pseudomonadota bacterium]
MKRWLRLLKHRWHDETDARRALDDAALARLAARVRASESGHGGEIRVVVEAGLPLSYLRRGLSARERAITLFGKLRVWDTEHNNGVLIYLLLAEHAIEIVADRAVARYVAPGQWDALIACMREAFRQRRFEAGLAEAVDAVDALLRQHFALAPGQVNPNELPDEPLRG